jgi:hypothetical protein
MKKEMRYLVPGDYMADPYMFSTTEFTSTPAMTGKAVSKKTTMAIIST